ncbi:putative F-box protein PP2-B12 [Argentina anserina]|uniref:putative F-box protein PP2-B12 n=1 Tax=Argentina anserina TaxID=57926 RepID=UPI0021768F8C|nr:putative F-box protein PP2-B12 [Potentilla anserina]XP_050372732.1 putative F-box protein PP2-B12 [Potentilla anserina]
MMKRREKGTIDPYSREKLEMKNMMISMLPLECISQIISLTSPCDACRSSLVSSVFKEAADSDFVWESFLPSDIKQIISRSILPSPSSLNSISKKDLYYHLRIQHLHILLDGNMIFALEEKSGKKCYMIGARGLSIAGEEDKLGYWQWATVPASRFSEVAELKNKLGLDIKAHIKTTMLSPGTTYAAYFVYQLLGCRFGFAQRPVEFRVTWEQSRVEAPYHDVVLDPCTVSPGAQYREDGWMEVEMGEFFVKGGDNATVECSVREVDGTKSGLLVEGVEFRPKLDV